MAKDLSVSRLCDAYGALLTEHRLEIMREFYDYDLSLAEIAENHGITRQAALSSIRQAERQLRDYESKMGLVKRSDELSEKLIELKSALDGDIVRAEAVVADLIEQFAQSEV